MTNEKVYGTLNKAGNWVDANGNPIPDEITKGWNKGANVKYPAHIHAQTTKSKSRPKSKTTSKTTKKLTPKSTKWNN